MSVKRPNEKNWLPPEGGESEDDDWKMPPELKSRVREREENKAPKKPPSGRTRLANYRLPEELLDEFAELAKKRRTTQTAIIEEFIREQVGDKCEVCGR